MLLVLVLLAVAVCTPQSSATDPARAQVSATANSGAGIPAPWPMYGGGPSHAREQAQAPALRTNASSWVYRTAGWVYGAPCVGSNETVYFSSWDEHLYSVHPDGRLRWRVRVGGSGLDGQVWSSPALSADEATVYIGANGSLQAVSTQRGVPTLRWAVQTPDAIFASPTVASTGDIYIGGLDGVMRAVSANGAVLWTYRAAAPIYASAAVSSTTVFFSTLLDGRVVALSRETGQLLWSKGPSLAPVPSSPSLSPSGTFLYSASSDAHLRAFHTSNGSIAWTSKIGVVDGSSPAVAASDGTVYIGCLDNYMYALSPRDGAIEWKVRADSMVQSSPAIGANGEIYFSSFKSSLYSVEAASGVVRWVASLGAESFSSPALGWRGLYLGANGGLRGGLHAFVAIPPSPSPHSSMQVEESRARR